MSAMWQGLAGLFGGAAGQMETNRQQQLEELKARNEEARRAAAERRAGILRNELAMDLQRQQHAFDQANPTIRNVMQGQFGQIQGIDTAGNVKELLPMNPLLKERDDANREQKRKMNEASLAQVQASTSATRTNEKLNKEQAARAEAAAKAAAERQGIEQVMRAQADYEKNRMKFLMQDEDRDPAAFERRFGAKPGTQANPIPLSALAGAPPEGTWVIDVDGSVEPWSEKLMQRLANKGK